MSLLNEKKLSDDMLDDVTGGAVIRFADGDNDDAKRRVTCNHCFDSFWITSDKKPIICPSCHKEVDEKKYSGPATLRASV